MAMDASLWTNLLLGLVTIFAAIGTVISGRNTSKLSAQAQALHTINVNTDGQLSTILTANNKLMMANEEQAKVIKDLREDVSRISEKVAHLPAHLETAIIDTAANVRVAKHEVLNVAQKIDSGIKMIGETVPKLLEALPLANVGDGK